MQRLGQWQRLDCQTHVHITLLAYAYTFNPMPQVAGARGGRATARRSDDGIVMDPSPTTSGPPSVLRARGLAERAAGADGAGPRLGLGSEHHWAGGAEAAIPSPRDAACVLPPVPSDAAVLPMGSAGFAGNNPDLDPGRGRSRLGDSLESIASLDDVPRRRRGFAGRPRAKACACSFPILLCSAYLICMWCSTIGLLTQVQLGLFNLVGTHWIVGSNGQ